MNVEMTNQFAIIGVIIAVGLGIGLVAHTWATRWMLPALEELATNGDNTKRLSIRTQAKDKR